MPVKDLALAILKQADTVYAMRAVQKWVGGGARRLAKLIVQLPFESWPLLAGPFWNLWNPKPLTPAVSPTNAEAARYVIDDTNP